MSVNMTRKKNTKNKRKILLIAVAFVAVVLVILIGSCVKQLTYDKVYNGVFINSVDVSGLNRDELSAKIPELFDKRLSKPITLKIDSAEYSFDTLILSPAIDVEEMTNKVLEYPLGTKIIVMSPIVEGEKGTHKDLLDKLRKDGYTRVRINNEILDLSEEITLDKNKKDTTQKCAIFFGLPRGI